MKILFLSAWYPDPPDNGSKLRINSLLRGLAERHEVTLLSFYDEKDNLNTASSALSQLCRKVEVVPRKPFTPDSWTARKGFLSLKPRSVVDMFSPHMARKIERAAATGGYDLAIASQIDIANYRSYFRSLPAIFEEVELGVMFEQFARADHPARRLRYGLTWAKHRRYLAQLTKEFNVLTAVSEQERQLLYRHVPASQGKVEIIPNGMALSAYQDVQEAPCPDQLIFTGSFNYSPNYAAMVWFLREVFPRLQSQAPDVKLIITGDHQHKPLPPAKNVVLTGFVDDIRPLVASSWISLAPIWTGGGTRLKILEAMALRTPVVATFKGAEGLDVQNGEHLLLADTPQNFAEAILSLLHNPELRQKLAENAFQLLRQKYDWQVIMPRFLHLVDSAVRA